MSHRTQISNGLENKITIKIIICTIILQAERDWNSWDDSPRTVTEHIQQYRQKLVQPKGGDNDEPAIDFFQVYTITPSVK